MRQQLGQVKTVPDEVNIFEYTFYPFYTRHKLFLSHHPPCFQLKSSFNAYFNLNTVLTKNWS